MRTTGPKRKYRRRVPAFMVKCEKEEEPVTAPSPRYMAAGSEVRRGDTCLGCTGGAPCAAPVTWSVQRPHVVYFEHIKCESVAWSVQQSHGVCSGCMECAGVTWSEHRAHEVCTSHLDCAPVTWSML